MLSFLLMNAHSKMVTPAKINLFLDALNKRPDGYHNISTVFLPVWDLTDSVSIRTGTGAASGGIQMKCATEGVPCDDRNLCWRAAVAFAEAASVSPAWEIELIKHIPVAAGLGGGSSDAAAVLQLLNGMYDTPLSGETLHDLAAGLGADVPFFLAPRPCRGSGRGEIIEPVECETDVPLVLVNPGFPISAGWAYSKIPSERPQPPIDSVTDPMRNGDLPAVAANLYNVLEFAALDKFPIIEIILDFLRQCEGCLGARMSGSGPTMFAVCRTFADAQQIAETVRAEYGPRFWVHPVSGSKTPFR